MALLDPQDITGNFVKDLLYVRDTDHGLEKGVLFRDWPVIKRPRALGMSVAAELTPRRLRPRFSSSQTRTHGTTVDPGRLRPRFSSSQTRTHGTTVDPGPYSVFSTQVAPDTQAQVQGTTDADSHHGTTSVSHHDPGPYRCHSVLSTQMAPET